MTSVRLNPAQRRAVEHEGGPLMVLAGPGAGKTAVIVERIARLIDRGVEPETIAAVTFTVKAAAQMRQRLAEAVGPERRGAADRVAAHTFHGLGRRMVRRFADLLGLPPEERYIDASQQRLLLAELIERDDLMSDWRGEGLDALAEDARAHLEAFWNQAIEPTRAETFARERVAALRRDPGGLDAAGLAGEIARLERFGQVARLTRAYHAECRKRGWLSFGDLNTLPVLLLNEHPSAAAIIRSEWRHAVVDEFQDVNPAQVRMLHGLFPPSKPGERSTHDLCVVGDDDQSIFAFRGSDPRAMDEFASDYSPVVVPLTENYRSQKCIIDAGNAVIAKCHHRFRPDKKIERAKAKASEPVPEGAGVECIRLDDWRQDGDAIGALILAERAKNPDKPWSDFAVLARNNGDIDRVESALKLERIPTVRSRRTGAGDDEGVKDVMAWARLLADPTDAVSARRLLVRPPASVPIERVGGWERAYVAALGRAKQGMHGAVHPGPYGAFIAEHAGGVPTAARFAAMEASMRAQAATLPADEAVLLIIRETSAAERDLLPAIERAKRIAAIVSVLRFVRLRQDRLPAPGDIGAFLAYYDRLDAKGKAFESDETIDAEMGIEQEEGEAGGVTLLTAHSAKGLEFDTVFVARVENGHGFPQRKKDDRLELPDGLRRSPTSTGAAPAWQDEERRLFYVACTRAKRRLVVLGAVETPKKRTDTVNYFLELTLDHPGLAVVRPAAEVFAATAQKRGELNWEQDEIARRQAFAEMMGAYKDRARAAAAGALDLADAPGLSASQLEAIAGQLREAAARLGAAAQVMATGSAPAWVDKFGGEAVRQETAVLARAMKEKAAIDAERGSEATAKRLCRPMNGPLRLSFSHLDAYERCPLCFYLKFVMTLPEAETAHRTIGTVVHSSLLKYYAQWRSADAEGAAHPGPERLMEIGRAEFEHCVRQGWPLTAAEERQALAMLRTAHEKFHDPDAHITEFMEKMIEVPYEVDGQRHSLIAKPDRVDDLGDGRYRIVDFKTGRANKKLIEPSATDLQMGIYTLAMDWVLGDEGRNPIRGTAEYWVLSNGERGRLDIAKIKRDKLRERIDAAVRGMLAGRFMPKAGCDGPCSVLFGTAE